MNGYCIHNTFLLTQSSYLLTLSLTPPSPHTVVTTTLTEPEVRVQETVGVIMLCVSKDLETAQPFRVTLTTIDGSATSKLS